MSQAHPTRAPIRRLPPWAWRLIRVVVLPVLAWAALVAVAAALSRRGIPLIDWARLDLCWPVLLALPVALFLVPAVLNYWRIGRDLPVDGLGIFVFLAVVFGGFALILEEWSIDWPRAVCALVCLLLLVLVAATTFGAWAYTELWRRIGWLNRAVVEHVRRRLEQRRFSRGRWGSRHCLCVLQGYYDLARCRLLQCLGDPQGAGTNRGRTLHELCYAGQQLVEYLGMRWNEKYFSAARRKRRAAETLREMITARLVLGGSPARVVARWKERLQQYLAEVDPEYGRMLRMLFDLKINGRGEASNADIIRAVFAAYQRVAQGPRVLEGTARADVCAKTWLLVSGSLHPQVRFDTWQAMRDQTRSDLLPDVDESLDVASLLAVAAIPEVYGQWCDSLPEPWNAGLKGRWNYALDLARRPPELPEHHWDDVASRAGEQPGWIYRLAFCTPRVLTAAAGTFALLLFACFLLPLAVVNPRVPWVAQWNTIDHVCDRRVGRDYTAGGPITSMADAGGRLVACQGERLLWAHKKTRMIRESTAGVTILDVAGGPGGDNAFALLADGGIDVVRPGWWASWTSVSWLDPPASPFWPRTSSSGAQPTVVGAEMGPNGPLLITEAHGAARDRWDRQPDRTLRRRRCREACDLPGLVRQAAFGDQVVWVRSVEGSGKECVIALDRRSLTTRSGSLLERGSIRRLDAGRSRPWAAVVDDRSRWALYPSLSPAWQGPYFEDPGEPGNGLQGSRFVRAARLIGSTAWLADSSRLYAYDLARRRLLCVEDARGVRHLAPLPESARAAWPSVLVAGDTGVGVVSGPDAGDKFYVNSLDATPVAFFGYSEQGNLCAYLVSRAVNGVDRLELRAIEALDTRPRPAVVIPAEGWKAFTGGPPKVVGVVAVKSGYLLATENGCFAYDPARHVYRDRSEGLYDVGEEEGKPVTEHRKLKVFQKATPCDDYVLAIADDNPYLLKDPDCRASQPWIALDPLDRTSPRELTSCPGSTAPEAGPYIFGRGGEGQIHAYRYPQSRIPVDYGSGRARGLVGHAPSENVATGDLYFDGEDAWKVAFLVGEYVCHYDGTTASMDQSLIPARIGSATQVVQLRLAGRSELYLRSDGTVFKNHPARGSSEVFGGPGPGFSPAETTTVVPGGSDDRVLVAGTRRRIFAYHWRRGTWDEPAGAPLPADESDPIVNLQMNSRGVFAASQDRRAWLCVDRQWRSLDAFRACTADAQYLWAAGPSGVGPLKPNDEAPATWMQRRYATGSGMRALLADARFAWKTDAGTAAVFTDSSQVGRYHAGTDTWETIRHGQLQQPSRFVDTPLGLVVLDGNRILRLDKTLEAEPLATLPGDCRQAAITRNGDTLCVAALRSSGIELECRDDQGKVKSSCQWAECLTPPGFDPRRVVHAQRQEASVLLWDGRGASAAYRVSEGTWHSGREARTGERLHGWFSDEAGNPRLLVLEQNGQSTLLEPVGRRAGSVVLPSPPQAVPARLRAAGEACRRLAARVPVAAGTLTRHADRVESWARWFEQCRPCPSDAPLLDTEPLRVVRQNGSTRYWLPDGRTWRELEAGPRGFAGDRICQIAFDDSGSLWCLQARRLRELRYDRQHGGLELTGRSYTAQEGSTSIGNLPMGPLWIGVDGRKECYGRAADGKLQVDASRGVRELLSLSMGNYRLAWTWRHQHGIQLQWRSPSGATLDSMPVWSHDDRLASQSVDDLALADDGEVVLLATKLGVLVREQATFRLRAIYPDLLNVRLRRLHGPEQVLIQSNGAPVARWCKGRLIRLNRAAGTVESVVPCGPWECAQVFPSSGPPAIRWSHREDGRTRRWLQEDNQGRFADDAVNWLGYDPPSDRIWLATRGGLWPCDNAGRLDDEALPAEDVRRVCRPLHGPWAWKDSRNGWQWLRWPRKQDTAAGSPAPMIAPPVDAVVANPAFQIEAADGKLTFRSGDGGPFFVDGRVFTDRASRICGTRPGLYVLVAGRCVLRRDPRRPGEITGFWPLPPELLQDRGEAGACRLTTREQTVRLDWRRAGGADPTAWDLVPNADTSRCWRRVEAPGRPLERFGPIAWIQSLEQENHFLPFFLAENESLDRARPLESWWDGDRLGWDRIRQAVALDDHRIVATTPVGMVVLKRRNPGEYPLEMMRPRPGLTSCTVARRGPEPVGVLAGGPPDADEWLVAPNDDGQPVFQTRRDGPPLRFSPGVVVGYRDPDASREHRLIEFREVWTEQPRSDVGSTVVASLRHELELAELPLLPDGQFIFDRAGMSCEVDPSQGLWVTAAPVSFGADTTAVFCMHRCSSGAGESPLVPVDVYRSPSLPVAIRPDGRGAVLGLFHNPDGSHHRRHVARAVFTEDHRIDWQPVPWEQAAGVFRAGDRLRLDVARLSWHHEPRYVGDEQDDDAPPLEVTPAGYPLFCNVSGGIDFSFDCFTSIAFDRKTKRLALGTRGGAFCGLDAKDPDRVLTVAVQGPRPASRGPIRLLFKVSTGQVAVRKIRYDEQGNCWASFEPAGRPALLDPQPNWTPNPASSPFHALQSWLVEAASDRASARGNGMPRSNDPRPADRRELAGLGDWVRDGPNGPLWVRGDRGIFKVLLDPVRPNDSAEP